MTFREYVTKSGAKVKVVTDGGIKHPGRKAVARAHAGTWFVHHQWLATKDPYSGKVTALDRDKASAVGNWQPFVMGSRILKRRRAQAKKEKRARMKAARAAEKQRERDLAEAERRIGPVSSCAEFADKAQALPRRLRRLALVDRGLL